MLINFCDPVLKPVISSSGACHEGYSVTNLISNDNSERQRGYLGYGSPPTTITIEFVSHVNIKHIVICPQVRSKKSLGFEISANCGSKFQYTGDGATEGDYERIGCTILGEKDKGVIFYKHNYKPKTNIEPNFTYISLFRHYAVGNTNFVKIKIFKALSSVPAIGRIEVWGEPGRSCSRSFKNYIYKLWHQNESNKSNHTHIGSAVSTPLPYGNVETKASRLTNMLATGNYDPCTELDALQLPDEFLDSITCNIMTLPFILPSGKVVDIQTLEKHKNYEAMYGRLPSDPFTGIRFTRESLPIPDHDLKRRIDRFLAENCHRTELLNIPRTTGTKPKIVGLLPTNQKNVRYIEGHSSFTKNTSSEHVIGRLTVRGVIESLVPKHNQCLLNNSLDTSQSKRKAEAIEGHGRLNKRIKVPVVPVTSSLTSNLFPVPSSQNSTLKKSHEQLLEDSLDLALKSALAGLPSFAKFNSESKKSEPKENKFCHCQCCKTPEMLFILPCKSLVCRNCLPTTIGNDKTCANCDSVHQSCDVERYHYQ